MAKNKTPTRSRTVVTLLLSFIIPFSIVWGVQYLWFQNYYVPSSSMENTLMVGDKVFAINSKIVTPKRGDIIVFNDSLHWLQEPDQKLVKRLIGEPGDVVACCTVDGDITINGEPYHEDYIVGVNEPFDPQTVPAGHVFVLGDNREQSADSRYHISEGTQFVSLDDFVAKVWVTWGWNFNWHLVK